MLHKPILRKGVPYKSIDVATVVHFRNRHAFVEVSQANAGLIRRDLLGQESPRKALTAFTAGQLIEICKYEDFRI